MTTLDTRHRFLRGVAVAALATAAATSAVAQVPGAGDAPRATAALKSVSVRDAGPLATAGYESRARAVEGRVVVGASSDSLLSAVSQAVSPGGSAPLTLELLRSSQPADDADTESGSATHRLHQTVDGLRVWGTDVKAVVRDGELVHTASRTVPATGIRLGTNTTGADAIAAAVTDLHGPAALADGFWHVEPQANPVIIPNGGVLETGWEVVTWTHADNRLVHTLVDSQGQVADHQERTSQDRYRVYTDTPLTGGQVVRSGPGAGNGSGPSPAGWLSSGTQYTRLLQGNNVASYMDTDDDNQPDGNVVVEIEGTDFLAVHDSSSSPATTANRDTAIQNMFWFTNIIHDALYNHGFTEGAGNFQVDNFGRGGAGGDSVLAEAQDGSGTNNANFATPADGSSPRMQMYIWDRTNPNRDSALDGDILWHEYGHGLTWRMIGSMSGSVSGAIGEGMSDVLAILKTNDDRVGEYSSNIANGIRSERYNAYSRTIGDFAGTSVHRDGEIYAATLWNAGWLFRSSGFGNGRLLDIAVDGMNFTPAQPTYLEMRDGLVAAAPAGVQRCNIWNAFAKFGMGEGATFTVGRSSVSIGESFEAPDACDSGARVSALSAGTKALDDGRWNLTVNVTLQGANRAGVDVLARGWGRRWRRCTTNANGRCNLTFAGLGGDRYQVRVLQVDDLRAEGKRVVNVNRPN